MVDWQAVEKRRGQGWDWDRIAGDPKVDFHADPSMGSPGRALRALYYRNRSRGTTPEKGKAEPQGKAAITASEHRWSLARVGYLLVPLFAIWFGIAYAYPSLVGLYVAAIPYLLAVLLVAIAILGVGLYRARGKRWNNTFRNAIVGGAVIGIVIVASFGGAAFFLGCPNLTRTTTSQIQGWQKAANPAWTIDGASVFMFYGSEACPYCSATSWAVLAAMESMGTVNQAALQFASSSSSDVFPNTPEVVVNSIQVSSAYVSLQSFETTNTQTIAAPVVGCPAQAYVAAYNPGGSIPFIVINGQYFHIGTMVDPTALEGLTPAQVNTQVQDQSGSAWSVIEPAANMLEAVLVKVNNGQPAHVAQSPNVASLVSQLT